MPDRWDNDHTGRVYCEPGDFDTEEEALHGAEIISMGVEWFYQDAITFAIDDPEYFDFIWDVLRGRTYKPINRQRRLLMGEE